jgi:uncharacterized integral membrane protein
MQLARKLLLVALFVAILVLGWRFAADHAAPVTLTIPLVESLEIPLWMALLVAFALGAVVVGAAAALRFARVGLLARRYRKIIRGLESEIHQLRNLPLSNDEPVLAAPASGAEDSPAPKRALGRGA